MRIQDYNTKGLNLIARTELKDQMIKVLMFRRLHSKNQNRIMIANSISIKQELKEETLENYLERIIRLL